MIMPCVSEKYCVYKQSNGDCHSQTDCDYWVWPVSQSCSIADIEMTYNADNQTQQTKELNAELIRILNNIIASIAKASDAPMSSDIHMASAITGLVSITKDWNPWDDESLEIVEDAKKVAWLLGYTK